MNYAYAMKMRRGFTIVEVAVVMAILAILATVGTVGYLSFRKDAINGEVETMATIIQDSLEKYYTENNEYPSSTMLVGGTGGDGRALANSGQYGQAASILAVKPELLQTKNVRFMSCSVGGAACTIAANDKSYVIYMTRTANDVSSSLSRTYTLPNNCSLTFPAPTTSAENGYTAYYLAYKNPVGTNNSTSWRVYRSNNGKLTSSNCSIAA